MVAVGGAVVACGGGGMGGRGSGSGTSMPWWSTIQVMRRSGLGLEVILTAYSTNSLSKPISMSCATTGVGGGCVCCLMLPAGGVACGAACGVAWDATWGVAWDVTWGVT